MVFTKVELKTILDIGAITQIVFWRGVQSKVWNTYLYLRTFKNCWLDSIFQIFCTWIWQYDMIIQLQLWMDDGMGYVNDEPF